MRTRNPILVWVVSLLLGVTAVALISVAYESVRASQDMSVRPGLDYRAFLSALDDLIRDAGGEELVRFQPVDGRLGDGSRIRYDTLVVVADTMAFPAFKVAGFLHDQVQAYNRFQRERLALSRERPEWFHRLEVYNPSVFRPDDDGEGATLGRTAAAWSLRVPSPAEEEWDGEVRARVVTRGDGLMGPHVTVPLHRPVLLSRRVEGRRQRCEFTPVGLDVRAYCLSEERIPQAIFRMAADDGSPGSAQAGWADLWVDGNRVSAGDSVPLPAGTLLRIDPLEPVVFGEYWEGVLSTKQWISGRLRRRSAFQPPLDLFAPLGTHPSVAGPSTSSSASLSLTVDADVSQELTEALRGFVEDEVPLPLDFGIAVLARLSDGEIVAVAEVGNRRSRGRSSLLERVVPGSAVKPLLAAAVLSSRPELASLRIPARTGPITGVLGLPAVPSKYAFRTALNCASPSDGWIDLTYFLRCSNNEYAAALVMAGLWDGEDMEPSNERSARFALGGRSYSGVRPDLGLAGVQVPRGVLLRGAPAEGLNSLFDLPADPSIADSLGRTDRVWQGLSFSDGTPARVPYEMLPSESRPALLAPNHLEGTDLSLLYRYAFGAWENRWTLLDLTNGFGRVVTDRRFQMRFVPATDPGSVVPVTRPGAGTQEDLDSGAADALGLEALEWYRPFLEGLGAVAVDGTAAGLRSSWRRRGLPEGLYVKTGTLAEPGESGAADDLFIKSLLFAVGNEASSGSGRLECGLVGGVYLRFREGPRRGSLPSYQVQFAARELGQLLEERWSELGACPADDLP